MTGNVDTPGDGARDDAVADAPAVAESPRPGRVAELALVAAALGLMVYLLGFVDDAALGTSLIGPLLLGGGLLAGASALPTVGLRMLVPAAVATLTGALLLLQADLGDTDSPVVIGALVLALLEACAAVGAALLHAGVLRPRPRKPKAAPAASEYQPGYAPFPGQQYPGQPYPGGQQYPGQPYPGSYSGYPGEPYPGEQYAGEHAYAQQARWGAQYGVPGYPPPPHATYATDEPAAPPAAAHAGGPVSFGSAADQQAAAAYRSGVPVSTGGSGAVTAPASGATPVHRSGAVPSRSYLDTRGTGVAPTGSHAAPEPAAREGEDDRTRAIPKVTDER